MVTVHHGYGEEGKTNHRQGRDLTASEGDWSCHPDNRQDDYDDGEGELEGVHSELMARVEKGMIE